MGLFDLFKKKEIKTSMGVIPVYESKELLPDDLEMLNKMLYYYKNISAYKEKDVIYNIASKIVELDKEEKYSDAYHAIGKYSYDEDERKLYMNKWCEVTVSSSDDLYTLGTALYEYYNDPYCDLENMFNLCAKRVVDRKDDVVGMCLYNAAYNMYEFDYFRIIDNTKTALDYMLVIPRGFNKFWIGLNTILESEDKQGGLKKIYDAARNDDPFAMAYILHNLKYHFDLTLENEPTEKYWNSKLNIVLNDAKEQLATMTREVIADNWDMRTRIFEAAASNVKGHYYKAEQEFEVLFDNSNDYEKNLYGDFFGNVVDEEDETYRDMKAEVNLLLANEFKEEEKGALYYYVKGSHIVYPTGKKIGIKTCLRILRQSIDMGLKKAYIPIIKYCLATHQIESAKKKCIYAMNANVLEAMVIYACLTHDSQDNREYASHLYWLNALASITDKSVEEAALFMNEFHYDLNNLDLFVCYFSHTNEEIQALMNKTDNK